MYVLLEKQSKAVYCYCYCLTVRIPRIQDVDLRLTVTVPVPICIAIAIICCTPLQIIVKHILYNSLQDRLLPQPTSTRLIVTHCCSSHASCQGQYTTIFANCAMICFCMQCLINTTDFIVYKYTQDNYTCLIYLIQF